MSEIFLSGNNEIATNSFFINEFTLLMYLVSVPSKKLFIKISFLSQYQEKKNHRPQGMQSYNSIPSFQVGAFQKNILG